VFLIVKCLLTSILRITKFLNIINQNSLSTLLRTNIMKHPVPFLIATLFAFILGTSMLRNKTCPCGVPASDVSMTTTAKTATGVAMAVNYAEPKAVEATVAPAPAVNDARVHAIEQRLRAKEIVLYFDYNQPTASLNDTQRKELEDIQYYIAQSPNSSLKVVGHTDSRGKESYNERLSSSRAKFVADYLAGSGTTSKFITEGKGENAPIATNSTAKGRAKNRRVVVSLM
jgi:outer membrane protein OmpA-like peptidoglycan-associated protein